LNVLKKFIPDEKYKLHETHILKLLKSSHRSNPWNLEESMIRKGMINSRHAKLGTPKGAAELIERLLDVLTNFTNEGIDEKWFFGVINGLAIHPVPLDIFSKLNSYKKEKQDETKLSQMKLDNNHDVNIFDDDHDNEPNGSFDERERDKNLDMVESSLPSSKIFSQTILTNRSNIKTREEEEEENNSSEYETHSTDELYATNDWN